MIRFMGLKLASGLAAIFGASILAFIFLRIVPGNPARLILGPLATQQAIDAQITTMGLREPIYAQYLNYMGGFLRGNWGFSYSAGQPVTTQVANRLPATVELALYAFLFAFIAAVVLAVLSTYRRRAIIDGTVRGLAIIGLSMPPFWFGILVLMLFFSYFGILPGPEGRLSPTTAAPDAVTHLYTVDALLHGQFATFLDAVWHLILPAITLGLAPFAFLVRLLRANLLDVSHEAFIVVVRSKGIGRLWAFARHALPNAFLPTLTAAGLILAQLLSGSVLVEKVFNWPGIGALVSDSIVRQDYAVVQAFILLSAFCFVVVNIIVDLLYHVIDPRVRVS
ncbi:MAG: transporter permease [Chloroflexi bacterium]|nr:transporter permease [Chloroflexota bacterium]